MVFLEIVLPLPCVVLRLHSLKASEQSLIFLGDPVHLILPLDVAQTLLWFPVRVAMIHVSCGVHNVVHTSEQLVVVTLYGGLSVLLNLQWKHYQILNIIESH